MAARHPVRVTAAAVVSDHDEALEPELAHDRDLIGGQGGLAAAHFRPWREGCERPWSRCRGSRSPEGRSDRITLPCPALWARSSTRLVTSSVRPRTGPRFWEPDGQPDTRAGCPVPMVAHGPS